MKQIITFTVRLTRPSLLDKLRSRRYSAAELRRVADIFENLKHVGAAQLCRDEAEAQEAAEQIRAGLPIPKCSTCNDAGRIGDDIPCPACQEAAMPVVLLCQAATEVLGVLESRPRALLHVTTATGFTFTLRWAGAAILVTKPTMQSESLSIGALHYYLVQQPKPFFVEVRGG